MLKQHQSLTPDDDVTLLHKSDGTVVTKNKDKAEILVSFLLNWDVSTWPWGTYSICASPHKYEPFHP